MCRSSKPGILFQGNATRPAVSRHIKEPETTTRAVVLRGSASASSSALCLQIDCYLDVSTNINDDRIGELVSAI